MRAQDQFVLVALKVAEYVRVATFRQGDRTARGEAHLASVDQVERRVLQHFGVHGQVFERRIDQAAHDGVGDVADTRLQRAEFVGHAASFNFSLEEVDQVERDAVGFAVWLGHRGR